MNALARHFAALPRAFKWAVLALGVIAFYFGLFEPALAFADRFNTRADALQRAVSRDRELASTVSDGFTLQSAQAALGSPIRPGQRDITPEVLLRVVSAVLDAHGVSSRNVSESSSTLSGDQAAALGVGEIRRLVLQVSFEADAQTVVDVLADLERAPEVAAISRLRIDKAGLRSGMFGEDEGLVRVTLSPEAWIARSSSARPAP
jgi:hypothetical protein